MPSKAIKVCVISPGLPIPPSKGGAIETVIYESVQFMKEVKICVFSEQVKPDDVIKINTDNIEYFQFKSNPFILSLQGFLNRIAQKGFFSLYGIFFIRNLISFVKSSPDIIHINNNFYYIPYLHRKYPNSRIVLHMHNDFLFYHRWLDNKYKKIINLADRIITVSEHVKEQIVKHYRACEFKIHVVHNGVSLKKFRRLSKGDARLSLWANNLRLKDNDKVIIYVGRLCEEKGVTYLIQAFREICHENKNAKLLIVGSSWFVDSKKTPYLNELRTLSAGIKDNIIFTGYIPNSELNYIYNLSQICVVPSVFNEPFGLVILEAMASGCAVIASRVGGIPEIIDDGKTGLLFDAQDSIMLYEKIKSLLQDVEGRERIVNNSLQYVKGCDWSAVAKKYEEVYIDMLKNKA